MRCPLQPFTEGHFTEPGRLCENPRASVGTMEESNDESVSYGFAMHGYS